MKNIFTNFINIISNRVVIFFLVIVFLYSILVFRLFNLQIVQGEYYLNNFNDKTVKTLVVQAPRGNIYDRNANLLATNETSFIIKIDPSVIVPTQELNNVIYDLIKLLEKNDEEFVDTLPISKEEPFEYLFDGSIERENRWKKDMGLTTKTGEPKDYSATESLEALRVKFKIDESLSNEEARKIVSIQSNMYMTRYSQYKPITIAYDVSDETVTYIEENGEEFPSIYPELSPLRLYPYGKYVSHIVGYTGKIPANDIDDYLNMGYYRDDVIGITGIEKSYEQNLSGENGTMDVAVTYSGKRTNVISVLDPSQGDDIFLTLDANLQVKTYDILEDTLSQIIMKKLNTNLSYEKITVEEAMISLFKANNIPVKDIFEQEEGTVCYEVKTSVLEIDENADVSNVENRENVKEIIIDLINDKVITINDLFAMMMELEIITYDESTYNDLLDNKVNSRIFFDKRNRKRRDYATNA